MYVARLVLTPSVSVASREALFSGLNPITTPTGARAWSGQITRETAPLAVRHDSMNRPIRRPPQLSLAVPPEYSHVGV